MPAYRSAAEADIREPVVARLREMIPGCRIIHEINAASFGNRIDVLAVGLDNMAAVEIKSVKDKLDRLPDQIAAMRGVSNHVFAALHEKFLIPLQGGFWPPEQAKSAVTWAWPIRNRTGYIHCSETWEYRDTRVKPKQCLPHGALAMLWRAELQEICATLGIRRAKMLTMETAMDHIRWSMTGREVTRAICAVLRKRVCVEGDDPCPS